MTIVGGVIGLYLVNSMFTFWLGILFAPVAGGFFYMIAECHQGRAGAAYRGAAMCSACTGERHVFRFQRGPS